MVFGQVIDGSNVVKSIENQKADARSKPYSEVRVANCGELVLQKKGRYSSHTHTYRFGGYRCGYAYEDV